MDRGAIKEGAGKLIGDKEMENDSARNAAGDVKDAARDAADALRNKKER